MTRLSQRFEAWVIGLGLLALAAVLRNEPGSFVADNRFEQYWNPGRRISRTFGLWDSTRGMGRVREEFWPGATMPVGLFRLLGASPALAEHLWHAALLTAAGTGMVALLRRFRPVLGAEHLLAGLLYMFGPYAATFLLPSNLFYHYALTPWLVVTLHRGLRDNDGWRSAAVFALLIFFAGNLDTPGILYGGVALGVVLVYELVVEREVRGRAAAGWLVRAGMLTALISAAALAKTAIGVASFSQRLASTETPEVIALTSSWSESLRGMGFWLSYFRDRSGHVRPAGEPFVTNPVMILATFLPLVIGLGALRWAQRWRHRLLFLGLLFVGTALMVGGYPTTRPPPWGQAWFWAVRHVPVVGTLRTTYKAGAIAGLGGAALFGIGVTTGARVLGPDPWRRRGLLAGGCAVVVAVSAPFWSGGLYAGEDRMATVPAYWTEAMSWLDSQPGDGQVLLIPGATRAVYRWGSPGDDIQDALMDRAHLTDAAVSLSTPLVADVLEAIDDAAVDGAHTPGSLAPVLRRLGIQYVVLRNDLDWRRMGVSRPATYSRLLSDPELQRVASFGRVGENTGGGPSDNGLFERDLRPIDVLEVSGAVTRARSTPLGPWWLLEGSGAGWLSMSAAGLLDDGAPIVPTALLGPRLTSEALSRGSTVVVTDSNRRRATGVSAYVGERSGVLAAGEDLGREIADLYGTRGSQSVAAFGDAKRISDRGVFRSLGGFRPEHRAAQAFDGDLRTGWVIGTEPDPRTRRLRVDFRAEQVIDGVSILAFDPRDPNRSADPNASFQGVPRIGRAAIDFSDGATEYINLISGRATVRFAAHHTTSFELRMLDVTAAKPVGIAEVAFPNHPLDLVEQVRLPDDVFRMAEGDPSLRQALEGATVIYLLDRVVGDGVGPVESRLRRELRAMGARDYEVSGSLTWPDERRPAPDARGCVDVGLLVDAAPVRVMVMSIGEQTDFTACDPVRLSDGWHRVAASETATLDHVQLRTQGRTPASLGVSPQIEVAAGTATTRVITQRAPSGGLVFPGDGYDARWRASVGGVAVGAPIPADAQNAWIVPAAIDPAPLTITFGAADLFRVGLMVTATTVGVCLALTAWPRRRSS